MTRPLPLLLAVLIALAGCGADDRDGRAPSRPAAERDGRAATVPDDDAGFERTWLGVLPCADCDGIQTRLQLVRDGGSRTYQLEETYLGADGDAVFTQEGDWVEEETEDGEMRFRLDPDAPAGRRYVLRADGALDQVDGRGRAIDGDGQYRLQRL